MPRDLNGVGLLMGLSQSIIMSYLWHKRTLIILYILVLLFFKFCTLHALMESLFRGIWCIIYSKVLKDCSLNCPYLVTSPFYVCNLWNSCSFLTIVYVIVGC